MPVDDAAVADALGEQLSAPGDELLRQSRAPRAISLVDDHGVRAAQLDQVLLPPRGNGVDGPVCIDCGTRAAPLWKRANVSAIAQRWCCTG